MDSSSLNEKAADGSESREVVDGSIEDEVLCLCFTLFPFIN